MARPRAVPSRHRTTIRYLILRLLAVALALLALQGLIYYRQYRLARKQALQADLELAHAVATGIHDMVTAFHRVAATIGYALTSDGGMTHPHRMRFLLKTAEEFPAVRAVAWTDARGRIVAASDRSKVGRDASGDPWFREIAGGSEGAVSAARRARDLQREYFILARGIRDERGKLLGVVAAEVSARGVAEWTAAKRLPGGAFRVVDQTGWLVFQSGKGSPLPGNRDWARTRPLVKRALQGEEAMGERRIADGRGEKELVADVPVPGAGWVAEASTNEAELRQGVRSGAVVGLAIAVGILLVAVAAAWRAERRITVPLASLRRHAAEVAKGNLEHRTADPDTAELAEVAEALNAMTEAAQEREREHQLRMEAERERSRLAEEITEEVSHHVRNTLAMVTGLLGVQTTLHPDPRTETLLRESIARIRTFANVHEMMYATRAREVDLLEALRRIVADTVQVLHVPDAVVTSVEGEHVSYPTRVVTNLAVAANELISNAIRHGAPGADGQRHVDLRVAREDRSLHLTVSNSGNPVPEGFDPTQHAMMGLQLVQDMIVARYGGTFVLRPTAEGSIAEIRVREAELLGEK
jgi:two-component sensor histidine kinase